MFCTSSLATTVDNELHSALMELIIVEPESTFRNPMPFIVDSVKIRLQEQGIAIMNLRPLIIYRLGPVCHKMGLPVRTPYFFREELLKILWPLPALEPDIDREALADTILDTIAENNAFYPENCLAAIEHLLPKTETARSITMRCLFSFLKLLETKGLIET